jgi:hypothetical protein
MSSTTGGYRISLATYYSTLPRQVSNGIPTDASHMCSSTLADGGGESMIVTFGREVSATRV